MTYNPQAHRRAFEAGANTYAARKVPGWKAGLVRGRVIRAFNQVYEAASMRGSFGEDATATYIMSLPKFQKEVGSIWLLLFSAVIQAIVKALIEYWWQTKNVEGQL